jgi:hypothetical protein
MEGSLFLDLVSYYCSLCTDADTTTLLPPTPVIPPNLYRQSQEVNNKILF